MRGQLSSWNLSPFHVHLISSFLCHPGVPWKLAATYPCRTEMLTGLMVQCKAGLSGSSGIGVQSVNWFVHFSAACSSNITGACVQQWQVLDPHSREWHRFLFSLFMNSLTTKQCISWAVREERPGEKKKKNRVETQWRVPSFARGGS